MHLPPISSINVENSMSRVYDPVPISPSLDRNSIQQITRNIILGPGISIQHLEFLPKHLHRLFAVHLSNNSTLVLKLSPSTATPILQHEQHYLQSEAAVLRLFSGTNLPIPTMVSYHGRGIKSSPSFLLATHLSGTTYSTALPHLPRSKVQSINSQLDVVKTFISSCTAHQFGSAAKVATDSGSWTWREAFRWMMTSILMDGEDMGINLPYIEIREAITDHAICLDEVRVPRLVILGFGRPQNVLIDRQTSDVVGLLDFGHAIWGDIEFGETTDLCGASIKQLL